MLKRKTLCCLACMLVAVSLFLAGCGGDKQGQEATEEDNQAQTGALGRELERLLAKSEAIKEIHFEFIVTRDGKEEMSGKTWIQGNRFKNELTMEGATESYIGDPDKDVTYVYSDARKEGMITDFQSSMTDMLFSPAKILSVVEDCPAKIAGTETYDGRKCKVIVITYEEGQEAKMWVWEEHGVPLRVEDKSEAQGDMILEFKNVAVGSRAVSNSDFEVPSGYKIEDRRAK